MPPSNRSPSRGKVTITLSNPNEEKQEKAKVTVTLDQPERMVERVVNQLARKFPPESVMTIDARGRTDSTSSVGSTTCDLSSTAKQPRLLREEVDDLTARTHQSYVISDGLDIAIPVAPFDCEVKLADGSVLPVDPNDVVTCSYASSGFISECRRGFCSSPRAGGECGQEIPIPQKPGLGKFAQSVVISDELRQAVPICPGQTIVHLKDGDLYRICADDVHTIFYSDKGLAHFSCALSTGRVTPGMPDKPTMPAAIVPMRVLSDEALPMATSSAAKAVQAHEKRVHVALFDETGAPICYRKPTGGLVPGPILHDGAATSVRYVYIPAARQRRKPCQVVKMAARCGSALLADNSSLDPSLPQDIDVILLNTHGEEIGAYVADRRPSLVTNVMDFVPSYISLDAPEDPPDTPTPRQSAAGSRYNAAHSEEQSEPRTSRPSTSRPSRKRNKGGEYVSDRDYVATESLLGAISPQASTKALHVLRDGEKGGAHGRGHRRGAARMSYRREEEELDSRDERSSGDERSNSMSSREDEEISRRQAYFKPANIDYAIPLAPGQSHVKLVSGDRIRVEVNRTFVVTHDLKGFPLYTIFPDGRRQSWALNQPGVGIKVQDFLVDSELLYAVPISPTQTEVMLNDGGMLDIQDENVITVYYDSSGRPAFSYIGKKRKIRPGLAAHPGIASWVQYVWLIDCQDGTDEQYVVPVKGFQKHVQDPHSPKKTLKVDRSQLTVLFFNEQRQALYTQLVDGALVSNGLTAVDMSGASEDAGSYKRVYREGCSEDQQSVMSIKGRGVKEERGRLVSGRGSSTMDSLRTQRKEVIERQVHVQKIEYRDKIVEVPEVHVVEKHVEVEKVEYTTKYVKKKQIVERPVEHVKYVPKIETKIVERIMEVPHVVEVERKEIIEQKVNVDNFIDNKKEVVVANTIIPVIRDIGTEAEEEIECLRLEPELVAVDVYVPRLVHGKLRGLGCSKEIRKEVDVSLGHYNSLVLKLNPHLGENYDRLPMVKTPQGAFPMLNRDAKVTVHQPTDEEILKFLQATGFIHNDDNIPNDDNSGQIITPPQCQPKLS